MPPPRKEKPKVNDAKKKPKYVPPKIREVWNDAGGVSGLFLLEM